MASKVKFSISVTPIEDNTDQKGDSNLIAASECYGTVSGNGEIDVTIETTGGSNDGYVNGDAYYESAAVIAENSVTPGTHGFVAMSCDILVIKHTGFRGDTPPAKSSIANTTDYLSVMVNAAAGTDICIARLKAGEAMILPSRAGMTSNNIMIASTNGSGSAGSNTIAVEFLAFT